MDEQELFEMGCFSPEWTSDTEVSPMKNVPVQRKDLNTLLIEMQEIKERIDQIREKQWHLRQLLEFHSNNFSVE